MGQDRLTPDDKFYLCYHLAQRYHQPSLKTVRKRLLYARAFQAAYFKLARAIEVPETFEKRANPELNQAIQVVATFQAVYNFTIGSCKQSKDENEERRLFREVLEDRLPMEAQTTLLAVNPFNGHLQLLANQLNLRLMKLGEAQPIEDELPFNLTEERFMALGKRKAELWKACREDWEHSQWLNTATSDVELFSRIQSASHWSALNSVVGSDRLTLSVRRAAAWRMIDVSNSSLEQAYGLVSVLAQLLNDPDKRHRPVGSEKIASSLLIRLKQLSAGHNLEPLTLQFEAKHALAKNRLQEAKQKFDQALDALSRQGLGEIRGQVARDALAVYACGLYPGFNIPACDQYKLSIIYYGGLEDPVFPIPTTAEMVEKVWEYFWGFLYQPYEGFQRLYIQEEAPH